MLHSFLIISGRGGIVLYRKVFTKSLNQPRLVAGLITALCEFAVRSVGQPASTIELENFSISVVEMPVDPLEKDGEYLRAVLFHDTNDGDFYGHVLGLELLTMFKSEYAERLLSMQLANVQGVEEIFKPFSSRVRPAILGSIRPLLESLESKPEIKQACLFQHTREGAFCKSLSQVWYPSSCNAGTSMIADMQALLSAGDDVLNAKGDQSGVVTIGDFVRIERLDGATFVVVSQKPTTVTGSQELIACYTSVLKQLLVLMRGLEGTRSVI